MHIYDERRRHIAAAHDVVIERRGVGRCESSLRRLRPQLDPTCTRIVFERLEDDSSPHGNYNIYSIGIDGNNEERLTDTGYSQGFASWSHSGDRLVFMVSAIGDKGVYDIYVMNADGSDCANVTPQCYPDEFLCSCPIFSIDDSRIYFVGEWWE
ncbi:MAG TPA: hypothetical protein PLC12_01745 [Candidatus Methanofastidiosa archaeon]|nr:hypothetical protein [Candidatus Methanofastidiosa archaeon]